MANDRRRTLLEGAAVGVLAGAVFAVAQGIAAALAGLRPWVPLRHAASVLLGPAALTSASLVTVALVSTLVHAALSGGYGALYGLLVGRMAYENRTDAFRQPAVGLLYGFLLWLVYFQVIARVVYPWFLHALQPGQLALHALAYGLPLAVTFLVAERRVSGASLLPRKA